MEIDVDTGTSTDIMDSSDEEFEEVPQQECVKQEASYKFILIEGTPNQGELQNKWARKWAVTVSSCWDIIDTNDKKFIELKVTNNEDKALNAYKSKAIGLESNSSLIIVNPTTGKTTFHPLEISAQGCDKVTSFILARCQVMRELGISDHYIHDEENLKEAIFCNEEFITGFNKWMESFLHHKNLPKPENLLDPMEEEVGPTLRPLDLDMMEKSISDPLENGEDYILWRGKILPELWVCNKMWDDHSDQSLVQRYMRMMFETSTKELEFIHTSENEDDLKGVFNDLIALDNFRFHPNLNLNLNLKPIPSRVL